MAAENQMQDEDFVDKQTAKAAIAYITGEIHDAELAERKVEISSEKKELAKSYFTKYKSRNSIVRNLFILLTVYVFYFYYESTGFMSVFEVVISNIALIIMTAFVYMFNEKEYIGHLLGDRESNQKVERITYAVFGYVPKYEINRIFIFEFFLNSILTVAIISGNEVHFISHQAYSIIISVVLILTNIIFMSFFRQIFMKNIK